MLFSNNHKVDDREPSGKKYHQMGPKCIRSILSVFNIFFWIVVVLLYARIKTTDKLMQFNILIFEFFYPYVHKVIRIICCKVVNVLGRSALQPLDQSMASYKVGPGFSGFIHSGVEILHRRKWISLSWQPVAMLDYPHVPKASSNSHKTLGSRFLSLSFTVRFLAWVCFSYLCEGASPDVKKGTSTLK